MAEEIVPRSSGEVPERPLTSIVIPTPSKNAAWKTALLLSGGALLQIASQFFANYLTTRGYLNVIVARFFLLISGGAVSLLIVLCVMAFPVRRKTLTLFLAIGLVVLTSLGLEKWAPKPHVSTGTTTITSASLPTTTTPGQHSARPEQNSPPSATERSRIHVVTYEMVLDNPETVSVNVYLQNRGTIDARGKRYQASVAFDISDDPAVEKQRELDAERTARKTIHDIQIGAARLQGFIVTPGSTMWFTHEPMVRFDSTRYAEFRDRKVMILFAGLVYYTDRNGSHRTYYCVRNNGNPAVMFSCGITGEE